MSARPEGLTVGFVDLAGFTALTEAHGDEHAVALLERFEQLARSALGIADRLVKTIGDAVMLAFPDPGAALDGSLSLFSACAREQEMPLPRAGLHHGPVIERDGDMFGATVNLAARVAGQASGGQLLATEPVAVAARGADLPVVDLGSFDLRNLGAPVDLFQISVDPELAGATIDPVCRMQVLRATAVGRLRHDDHEYWFCSLKCSAAFASDPDRYREA